MSRIQKVRLCAFLVSLLLAGINAWAGRSSINPDAVAYLDAGDDLIRGDFWNFINAHWSPAYPAILGLCTGWFVPHWSTSWLWLMW